MDPYMEKELNQAILALRPRWNRDWERTENGRVVILMPKFGTHPLGQWFMKHLRQPYYRLKLDEVGSFVWEQCNGMENVEEIGRRLQQKFGNSVEPVYERLTIFFNQLQRLQSIVWV